ncbi:MAG: hypothetical protein ABIZ49_03170, partial [Opitutaceae bacterium]
EKFKPAMENLATMHERNVADKLASQLYYTDSPLTAQQAVQLIQVLAQNRYRQKSDTMGGVSLPADLASGLLAQPMAQTMPWMIDALVTDAAIARAADAITPTQLAALKVLQAQQVAELQIVPPVPVKDPESKSQ